MTFFQQKKKSKMMTNLDLFTNSLLSAWDMSSTTQLYPSTFYQNFLHLYLSLVSGKFFDIPLGIHGVRLIIFLVLAVVVVNSYQNSNQWFDVWSKISTKQTNEIKQTHIYNKIR